MSYEQDDEDELLGDDDLGHGFGARWRRAVAHGVATVVRVSTRSQALTSRGSLETQRDQAETLKSFGIDPAQIIRIELLGESASPDADRPRFRREVLGEAEAGRIRVVSITKDDRLSRNGEDAEALFDALAEHNGFVVVGEVIYDPSNDSHRMMLRIGSAVAEHEDSQRTQRLAKDRFNKAKLCEVVIGFTAAFTWLDPTDPQHCRAAVAAGLGDWLEPARLNQYKARGQHNGRTVYPFPYPDREVVTAISLLLDWMF